MTKISNFKNYQLSTKSIHAGEYSGENHYSLTTPTYNTSTYYFRDTKQLHEFFKGNSSRIAEYGRYGNPTQKVAELKLKELDNAESALLFTTGMNAIISTILGLCKSGDHIVITNDSYRRTRQFLSQMMTKYHVKISFVEPEADFIEKAFQEKTQLFISESPTNPFLHVLDLKTISSLCKKYQVKSLIDSTFATPYNQKPLDFGIDLVIHSITKYLGGHNDILGGVLLGKEHLIQALKEVQAMLGGILDAHSCYLLIRGLKTFHLRIKQQNESGMQIAMFLEKHPKIKRVWYPGLESHPNHKIAKEQMKGFGGVISFLTKNENLDEVSNFIDRLQIPKIAPSLGGVESLVEQPALMSYYEMPKEKREEISIYDNLVRLSIGVEDAEDIIQDLHQALKPL